MSINNITNHLQIEMKAAIKQQKATAPGKGTIHLQMIKRCSELHISSRNHYILKYSI